MPSTCSPAMASFAESTSAVRGRGSVGRRGPRGWWKPVRTQWWRSELSSVLSPTAKEACRAWVEAHARASAGRSWGRAESELWTATQARAGTGKGCPCRLSPALCACSGASLAPRCPRLGSALRPNGRRRSPDAVRALQCAAAAPLRWGTRGGLPDPWLLAASGLRSCNRLGGQTVATETMWKRSVSPETVCKADVHYMGRRPRSPVRQKPQSSAAGKLQRI